MLCNPGDVANPRINVDDPTSRHAGVKQKLISLAASIGPGIFIIGYIIGTGSVTSMAKSGAEYGMSLTWALALSCLCTYVLVVAISRLTIATGQTSSIACVGVSVRPWRS